MNYVEARQLSDKSGWHMTTRNDGVVHPLTCCRTMVPAEQEDVDRLAWLGPDAPKLGELISGPAHEAHPTREEAEKCFHDWLDARLEESLEFTDGIHMDWTGCTAEGCDEPTKGGARYRGYPGPEHVSLCPVHRTLEVVKSLQRHPTSICHS